MKRSIALGVAGLAALALVPLGSSPAAGGPLPDPAVAVDGNLLANPSFDVGDQALHPVGWTMTKSGANDAILISTEANRHGGWEALRVTDATQADNIYVRHYVSAYGGVSYTAKAWFKGASGTEASLYLEFYDAANARIGVSQTTPAFSTSWQQATVTLTAPVGTVHAAVLIYSGTSVQGVTYVDDASLVAAAPAYSAALGTTRELFTDDYRIESAVNVGRKVHPAVKRATPVIVPDQPWESSDYIYGSVVTGSPGAAYKMWYTCYNATLAYLLCYATSTDGITWTKPNLGKYTFEGSTANNIVGDKGGTVIYDAAATDPARRYKMLTYIAADATHATMGYYAFFSPDGITWTQFGTAPVLPYGDVSNVSLDAAGNRFIATTKQRTVDISASPGTNDRMAWVSTSSDFVTWSAPRMAVEGDYRDDEAARGAGGLESQVYGMPVYPYEGVYLAMPWMFTIVDSGANNAGSGPIVPQLATSRDQDLLRWSRPARDPVLPLGDQGAWDDSMIFTSSTLQTTASTVSVYYGGFNVDHGGGPGQTAKIGLATWRRDGFVSLRNAGDEPGTVTTKPVSFTGSALHLNTAVMSGGLVKVEVLNSSGTVVATANPVTGDQLDATVTWASGVSLSSLAGQQVRFRFTVDGADLYSYWVA
ncbi:hypothetical protein Dvina_46085 [Dactylosporangium vinaceum]|uniref:CBM-cenC domain-containing protein n=1 Tax=Dactylosporangium vinaceum TaxID=53362 RepID=A0ABV5M7A3_9ACTN|nr:hypothetical protein [Dactylosporangium vinaceum]UAB95326.1 hypothetical protein Dvina_46085 [Dactylosporangium vinaceum]